MVKRVSKQQVVKPAPVVVSNKNPDAIFIKDNSDIIFTEDDGSSFSGVNIGAFNLVGSSGSVASSSPKIVPVPAVPVVTPVLPPDVPSLADIESITMEEYADSNGVSKYKAVIKIRNSSRDKLNVIGVDARIYDPNGSLTYTLGTATASSASAKSAYISNTTWYQAVSLYNPEYAIIYSAPYIKGNEQYLSDGSNVPKDAIIGISSSMKQKSVWRKTEAEALSAATPVF
jgi:hypothetical protein